MKEAYETAGQYAKKIFQEANRIKRKARWRSIRRGTVSVLTLILCAFAVYYGIEEKSISIEKQYREFLDNGNREVVDFELLGYKDTFSIFEQNVLGNQVLQMQMGGHFYNRNGIVIIPDKTVSTTVYLENGVLRELSPGLVSEINVYNNQVYFKDSSLSGVWKYDLSSRRKEQIQINDIDCFSIYDGEFIYIKSNERRLMRTSNGEVEIPLVNEDVESFAIAGNRIIYLAADHRIHSLHLSSGTDTVLQENVNSFLLDGSVIWYQNNGTVYRCVLDHNITLQLTDVTDCRRILGKYQEALLYDGENGLTIYNTVTKEKQTLPSELFFVGLSDDGMLLLFDWVNNKYIVKSDIFGNLQHYADNEIFKMPYDHVIEMEQPEEVLIFDDEANVVPQQVLTPSSVPASFLSPFPTVSPFSTPVPMSTPIETLSASDTVAPDQSIVSAQYKELKPGSKGQAVLNARMRMYELGYFKYVPTQKEYTRNMMDYVKQFEKDFGLEQDGILSPDDQVILFDHK